jgi:predicted DNA-binding protein (UPF0251 family)
MKEHNQKSTIGKKTMDSLASQARQILREPILKLLLQESILTKAQLETLLIDIIIEDRHGDHIPYQDKAKIRSQKRGTKKGVTRGAFNRTLKQARRNITKCMFTMLLLAYLDLFNYNIFRPFEEASSNLAKYRRIRGALSEKEELTPEELESYKVIERTILTTLEQLMPPLSLKSDLARRRLVSNENASD